MFPLNCAQFLENKGQALMDTFLWSVDIVCHEIDLILFRSDFQIMSQYCGEVITE